MIIGGFKGDVIGMLSLIPHLHHTPENYNAYVTQLVIDKNTSNYCNSSNHRSFGGVQTPDTPTLVAPDPSHRVHPHDAKNLDLRLITRLELHVVL
jgi:hypothetical protein